MGLEGNVKIINDSCNEMRKALKKHQKVKIATGLVAAVLNAVSLGIANGVAEGALAFIVDYGDVAHIQEVAETSQDENSMSAVEAGKAIGDETLERINSMSQDRLENKILDQLQKISAMENEMPLIAMVATAQMTQKSFQSHPQQAKAFAPESSSPKFGFVDRIDTLGLKLGAEVNQNYSLFEKLGKLEEAVYGTIQSGSLKDRLVKLEGEL